MSNFTIYPAIDLRNGKVVRLKQGDPNRQTTYSDDPASTARRWLEAGARWLHVVNLDGALSEGDNKNWEALHSILQVANDKKAMIQFGGGLRTFESIRQALDLGISRIVLGTIAVEQPHILEHALTSFGPEHVAAGIDALNDLVQVRGWQEQTAVTTSELAARLASLGLKWIIFTDVARDGVSSGLNIPTTRELARTTGLRVIASGGVDTDQDIQAASKAGLAGVIVGRALYEGRITIRNWG
jgi:phosphoribosylformimino-5-aminoimidazole carboxamide ribotide isomerase